ncbi:MAG: hypothetical protein RI957_1802 [Verrucomicrobiota bacterium]|jgi:lysophospholipase L1-like esterase
MVYLFSLMALLVMMTFAGAESPTEKKPHDFAKWEKDIVAFEKRDAANPPAKHALLFIGSSGIVRWKSLAQDFPGATILNRAFGGNEIADSTYFAERMIFPYEPKMIFLRAGGNDIHAGKSAEEVFDDYKTFVATIRVKLPNVPIAYIALSPSPARWNEKPEGDKLNAAIADESKKNKNLIFIDASSITLDAAGKIRPELFVADQLHFNEAGYKLLAEAVRPYVPH